MVQRMHGAMNCLIFAFIITCICVVFCDIDTLARLSVLRLDFAVQLTFCSVFSYKCCNIDLCLCQSFVQDQIM